MKAKIIKRMMTGALAVSLIMAPAMSVGATTTISDTTTIVEEIIASSTSSASGSGTTISTIADVPSTSTVAGVKSTAAGVYLATGVDGSVVTTSVTAIKEGYGLTSGETPYAKFSNLDIKKSPLAKQAIDLAAASQGATVGPILNVELGKMSAGKYSLLPSDGPAIRLSFGIPKSFAQAGKTYAIVVVRAGGAVTILNDLDTDPDTITFDTTGGAGAYAIIRY